LFVVQQCIQNSIPECKSLLYNFQHEELQLEMTSGETIPFSMLSDGYRNFVGMVADIAWRAVQLNPHYGAEAAEKVEGVVLIDELELHLHPSWQRQVLRDLCDTFPRLQFVVTTHSPQILASAKAEWVRVLEDGESTPTRVSHLYGKDSNTVLEDIMGATARPQEMQEKLDKIADLIEEEEWDEAERYLEGEIVPYLGEVDAEVVGIRTELALEKALADE
jgi:predicted ATP-binding protein involved in virulence